MKKFTSQQQFEMHMIEIRLKQTQVDAILKINCQSISALISHDFIHFNSKLVKLKKKVRILSITFKLDETFNYKTWKQEIWHLTFNINVTEILNESQYKCSKTVISLKQKKWKIRFKILFKLISTFLKYQIRKNIRRLINEIDKNTTEI